MKHKLRMLQDHADRATRREGRERIDATELYNHFEDRLFCRWPQNWVVEHCAVIQFRCGCHQCR
eukprot:7153182-Lingulodinium_polyedra.AAC.1